MLLGSAWLGSGATGYAFSLGLVGAANPCGLPLLPAYLSLFADRRAGLVRGSVGALAASACVTAGFVVCFGVLGSLLGAAVAVVESWVPWIMVAVGAAVAAVGIAGLAGWQMRVPLPRLRVGRGSPLAMFGFGVLYGMGSLGCALPVYLLAVGGGLERSGVAVMLRSTLAYALGMGVLLAVLALSATAARRTVVQAAKPIGRAGHWLAGLLLTGSGCYLSFYWATTLADPHRTPGLVSAVNRVQAWLSSWGGGHGGWLGLSFGVVVIAVLVAASLRPTTRVDSNPGPEHGMAAVGNMPMPSPAGEVGVPDRRSALPVPGEGRSRG
jgi:cytochrome c-type biogenesis protein